MLLCCSISSALSFTASRVAVSFLGFNCSFPIAVLHTVHLYVPGSSYNNQPLFPYTKLTVYLTFICPCIASISLKYNQQDAKFSRSSSISSTTAAGSSIGLTTPDAVFTVLCSWLWAEEPPETYRAIYRNKSIEKTLHLVSCTSEMTVYSLWRKHIVFSVRY
jgi:hypothetical protein